MSQQHQDTIVMELIVWDFSAKHNLVQPRLRGGKAVCMKISDRKHLSLVKVERQKLLTSRPPPCWCLIFIYVTLTVSIAPQRQSGSQFK